MHSRRICTAGAIPKSGGVRELDPLSARRAGEQRTIVIYYTEESSDKRPITAMASQRRPWTYLPLGLLRPLMRWSLGSRSSYDSALQRRSRRSLIKRRHALGDG